MYIKGLGDGISVAGSPPAGSAYCPPERLPFTTETYLVILDNEITRLSNLGSKNKVDDLWIEVLLFSGLKNVFPCSKSK